MALMRLEISFYAANIRGENSLLLFILSKRFGWICGLVLRISRYDLSLRATYVVYNHGNTQYINCVDVFGIIYVLYFW